MCGIARLCDATAVELRHAYAARVVNADRPLVRPAAELEDFAAIDEGCASGDRSQPARLFPMQLVMADGERILFAIPWGERVILGTTDTDYDGALNNPPCDAADVQYVLGVVNDAFPDARSDARPTWSASGAACGHWWPIPNGNPSDISRRHEVADESSRLVGCHGWQAHHLSADGGGNRRRHREIYRAARSRLSNGEAASAAGRWTRDVTAAFCRRRVSACGGRTLLPQRMGMPLGRRHDSPH